MTGATSVHRYTTKQNHAEPILTQVDAIVFWKWSESACPGLWRENEKEGKEEKERSRRVVVVVWRLTWSSW